MYVYLLKGASCLNEGFADSSIRSEWDALIPQQLYLGVKYQAFVCNIVHIFAFVIEIIQL